jgi:hypothetical protein
LEPVAKQLLNRHLPMAGAAPLEPIPARRAVPAQAEHARERLAAHLDKSDRLASRFEAKRMRAAKLKSGVGIRAASDVSADART